MLVLEIALGIVLASFVLRHIDSLAIWSVIVAGLCFWGGIGLGAAYLLYRLLA